MNNKIKIALISGVIFVGFLIMYFYGFSEMEPEWLHATASMGVSVLIITLIFLVSKEKKSEGVD